MRVPVKKGFTDYDKKKYFAMYYPIGVKKLWFLDWWDMSQYLYKPVVGTAVLLEVDIVVLVVGNPAHLVGIVRAVGIVPVVAAGDQPSC